MIESYLEWLAWIPAHPIQSLIILVVEFIVLMKLYHHFEENEYLKVAIGIFYQPQNYVANATVISLIGLELPQWHIGEYATTQRMKRWKTLDPYRYWWRVKFATRMCDILNWADKGHC